MDILVAHDHRTGQFYAREFGLERPYRIVTTERELMGYSSPTTFLFVNSDNGTPDQAVVDRLRLMEALGCEVDWVGMG